MRHRVEARYWEALGDGRVRCSLCPRGCELRPGQRGFCRVRENIDGILYAVGFGEAVSIAVDPIEKKPLYHFYPGSKILSLGCNGCNMACLFCQNWQISQADAPTSFVSPERLLNTAKRYGSIGIAFTYSEPMVWFEYILNVAKMGRPEGLKMVLVTNGVINAGPLEELTPWIDAMNVDLKSIREEFYRKYSLGPYLNATLHTIEEAYKAGVHIEVTNLVIPGLNDSEEEIRDLVKWITSLSPLIPTHFSRFFPHHKMGDRSPTPVETLARAREMAQESLKYVYVGNVWTPEWNTTFCHCCGEELIIREGYFTPLVRLKGRKCPTCGEEIPVVL